MSNDKFSPAERSRIMSLIRSKNTRPEIALRRALWRRGLRYRLHSSSLPGKPDIVFAKAKVVVFVDGAFWHGRKLSDERFAELPEYWRRKIETNMQRDARNTAELQRTGYMVLRFSDKEVLKQPSEVALDIERIVRSRIDSG